MNLQHDTILHLRSFLIPVDKSDADLTDLRQKIEQAEGAAGRLEQQITGLNDRMAEVSHKRIKPDTERVAALISGADVPQPDKKDIEARAAELRAIEARRLQVTDDLAAIREHLATLHAQFNLAQRERDQAELALLTALGDAYLEAYKKDAVAFIRSHVPPLHSLANLIREKRGNVPDWWHMIANSLSIGWYLPGDGTRMGIAGHPIPKHVNLWPRLDFIFDGKLLSGEPSSSPEIVEGLISDLRAAE